MTNQFSSTQTGGIVGGTVLLALAFFGTLFILSIIFSSEDTTSEATPKATPIIWDKAVKTKTSRCEKPSKVLVATIASDLQTNGEGSLRHAYAVRSNDFEKAWFLAADIQAPGIESEGDIGVWSVNAIDDSHPNIIAANAVAREFTTWGTAGNFSERTFSSSNDGFEEARKCAGGR